MRPADAQLFAAVSSRLKGSHCRRRKGPRGARRLKLLTAPRFVVTVWRWHILQDAPVPILSRGPDDTALPNASPVAPVSVVPPARLCNAWADQVEVPFASLLGHQRPIALAQRKI